MILLFPGRSFHEKRRCCWWKEEGSRDLVEEGVTSLSRPPNQRARSRAVPKERFGNTRIRWELCGFMEGILGTRNY